MEMLTSYFMGFMSAIAVVTLLIRSQYLLGKIDLMIKEELTKESKEV